ncbi:hypothetical protein ACWEN4_00575 [Streptomyces violaceorubidus]
MPHRVSWDRLRETALEVDTLDGDPAPRARPVCALGLTSAERSRTAWLSVTLRSSGGKRAKHLGGTGRLHLDLGRWWQGTGHRRHPSRAPLSGTLTHPLARRPSAPPLATAVPGRRARRACAEALDRAAAAWNTQVRERGRKDGERPGAELADALLGP